LKKLLISGLVAVHLVASVWHGSLHSELRINLSTAQNLFVLIVIVIAPMVGAVLVWTRLERLGFRIVCLSMVGALLFGVFYHFIFHSADNIRFLPPDSPSANHQFTLSAGVIALLELASAVFATFWLKQTKVRRDH